jgi:hypothetical protein
MILGMERLENGKRTLYIGIQQEYMLLHSVTTNFFLYLSTKLFLHRQV